MSHLNLEARFDGEERVHSRGTERGYAVPVRLKLGNRK